MLYILGYNLTMYEIRETATFSKWLIKLKDIKAQVAIIRRVERVSLGLFGDNKSLGGNLSELKIDIGAGYRVYYTIQGKEIVLLLIGGDKSTQQKDIQKAKTMMKELNNEN